MDFEDSPKQLMDELVENINFDSDMHKWKNVKDILPREGQHCIIEVEYKYADDKMYNEYEAVFTNKKWLIKEVTPQMSNSVTRRVRRWIPIENF